MLNLRQQFLPRLISETIALGFVFFILPAIYIFELSIAIPAFYAKETGSWWPCIHSILGTYVMFNLLGNLIGAVFVDTSFKGAVIEPTQVYKKKTKKKTERPSCLFLFFTLEVKYWFFFSRLQNKDGTFVQCVKNMLLPVLGTVMCAMHAF